MSKVLYNVDRRKFLKVTSLSVLGASFADISPVFSSNHPAFNSNMTTLSNKDGLYFWFSGSDTFEGEFLIDDQLIASISYVSKENGLDFAPVCKFELSPYMRKVTIRGTFTAQGKSYKVDESRRPVDVSSVTAPLFDPHKNIYQRLDGFSELLKSLSAKYGEDIVSLYAIQPNKKFNENAFQQVEARLGISLPNVFRAIDHYKIELGKSYYVSSDQLTTLTDLMVGWGDDHSELDAPVRARYERSIVAFVEVGDGIGAIAFDPQGVSPDELLPARKGLPVNQTEGDRHEGAWFYFHQESSHQPSLLVDGNNRLLNDVDAILAGIRMFALDIFVDDVSYLGEFGALRFGDFGSVLPPHILFDSSLYSNYMTLSFEIKKGFLREKAVPSISIKKYNGYGVL